MNKNAGYIAGLITHRYNYLKHYEGQFYFKPKEWQDETKHIVLEMLKEGKSYDEIKERVDVTRGYVDLIERIAIKKGVLPKR